MATVRIPTALSRYAGGAERIEVDAATVGDALAAACREHPDLTVRLVGDDGAHHPHLAVFAGDRRVERGEETATGIGPEEIVTVLVSVAGG